VSRIEAGRSYIGGSVVRPQTARLLAGRGVFTDDVILPRLLHVAFLRSPHAHARIVAIDTAEATALPGVAAVVTGEAMVSVCSGWVGTLAHFQGMKSAMQRPLAVGKASWQGEPVAAVVAESRAIAEDGVARVRVTWDVLSAVTDPTTALDPTTPVIPRLRALAHFRRSGGGLPPGGRRAERDLHHGPAYGGAPRGPAPSSPTSILSSGGSPSTTPSRRPT